MIDWKFNPENYESNSYPEIPDGDYRVKIEEAKEQVSRSGKEMMQLKLKVNGYNIPIWHYVVFDTTNEESQKRTDQKLGSIYESFEIERGNVNAQDWTGKTGGARIKNRYDDRGEKRPEVHYFLSRKRTEKLPRWEGEPSEELTYPELDAVMPF